MEGEIFCYRNVNTGAGRVRRKEPTKRRRILRPELTDPLITGRDETTSLSCQYGDTQSHTCTPPLATPWKPIKVVYNYDNKLFADLLGVLRVPEPSSFAGSDRTQGETRAWWSWLVWRVIYNGACEAALHRGTFRPKSPRDSGNRANYVHHHVRRTAPGTTIGSG